MNAEHKRGTTVAFLMDEVTLPPDPINLKAYYLTQEMIRRGLSVFWLRFGRGSTPNQRDGIMLADIPSSRARIFSTVFASLRLLKFCAVSRVRLVYCDEWLFYRRRPLLRVVLQVVLKLGRISFVLDQRDPYIDMEIADGRIREGNWRHGLLRWEYGLVYRFSDLIILPSKAYATAMESRGVPKQKLVGEIRGIDRTIFRPGLDKEVSKVALGLNGKFVIGWFGHMQKYRQIKDVIIPLIRTVNNTIPDSYVLVGGDGPYRKEFDELEHSHPPLPFRFLGPIPHREMPKCISACDVLLCPVDTSYQLTLLSAPLKILEAVSTGRPIIASRTMVSYVDYAKIEGIIWTGTDLQSFLVSLSDVYNQYNRFSRQALEQAENFAQFSTGSTIPRLVDIVLSKIAKGPQESNRELIQEIGGQINS